MARGLSTILSPIEECRVAPTSVTIGHVQLRDVLICPHTKDLVSYVRNQSIYEHDIAEPHTAPRKVIDLNFIPNTLSALILPDTGDTILAAGGQEAELHLSYYMSADSCSPSSSVSRSTVGTPRGYGRKVWESKYILLGSSINNSVMLTSMSFSRSNESAAEPRILVSNNDKTVKFYDIALRKWRAIDDEPRLVEIGELKLDVPVNHSSVSPDGRTLLSVGDSPDVYLHRLTGGAHVSFAPIAKLSLSSYIQYPHAGDGRAAVSSVPASFSTSFSADGSKFAVASQEGVVVVWDVRSTKPLKVFHTDKTRTSSSSSGRIATGSASGWLYDVPWDWSRGGTRAPGWGVRSVKFSPPGVGREVMTFTEHTSLLHVVDARTFETEEIVRMPNFDHPMYHPPPPRPRSHSPTSRTSTFMRTTTPSSIPLTDPRRMVLFNALEDTFRIPTSESSSASTRRSLRRARRIRSREVLSADEDQDDIVVIPPLGDREVDNNVRRLLGSRFGSRTALLNADSDPREPLESGGDGPREGEEIDVDELESDCLSSHAPSRSGSPAPASQLSLQSSGIRPLELLRSRPTLLARRESNGPYSTGGRWAPSSASGSRRHRRGPAQSREAGRGEESVDEELDLAGVCFDPSGTSVYVASVKGIAGWRVRGAEQQWWAAPEWA
ncbi:WD40-repeat-containing domain protein [Trametes polyzona]|nr:WD40-repeat-containing domain protein [Trametes polyzona]